MSILRNPVHPLPAAIAVGLWIVSLFCDLLYLGGAEADLWSPLALYTMVGGFVAALAAAVPRFREIKETGLAQVPVHVIVVSLYAASLGLRLGEAPNTGLAIVLSAMGVSILAVLSWLAGARVPVQGVGE
ncbi:MAG TPA: DUF2231 domain-containing protein [Burkholderiales bacterium]|nr:DUF2231 domain-containing protein [Burkholderiales bacterium]